jgi:hypothetical protein
VRPSPNRKPVVTGLEIRSAIDPRRSSPAIPSTAATTSAKATDSAAKRSGSPPASGPTADADSADVAVVALTMTVRDVPSSA